MENNGIPARASAEAPPKPPEPQTVYVLNDLEKEFFAGLQAQMNALNAQSSGAALLILKQHRLEGTWTLSGDFTRLVKG